MHTLKFFLHRSSTVNAVKMHRIVHWEVSINVTRPCFLADKFVFFRVPLVFFSRNRETALSSLLPFITLAHSPWTGAMLWCDTSLKRKSELFERLMLVKKKKKAPSRKTLTYFSGCLKKVLSHLQICAEWFLHVAFWGGHTTPMLCNGVVV